MMRASKFRYVAARTIGDAAAALADAGPAAMLLGGGTDLVPNMKRRQQIPETLVSLRRVGALRELRSNGEIRIGSGVTLSEIVRHDLPGSNRALHSAAVQVATPLIRNSATIGGNLCLDTRCNYYNQNYDWRQSIDFCKKAPAESGGTAIRKVRNDDDAICWVAVGSRRCWAVSSTDCGPALIALGARVTLLSSKDGEREIPLEALYHNDGMDFLTKRWDEVLTSIRIPQLERWRSTYWKLRRREAFDFPVLSVAAAIRFGSSGVVEDARIVLGAVASYPIVIPDSTMLIGSPLTDDAIETFAEAASKWAKPLDNTDFAMTWRKRVAKSYFGGVLREIRGDDVTSMGLHARHAQKELPRIW